MFTLPAWLDRQKITNLVIKNWTQRSDTKLPCYILQDLVPHTISCFISRAQIISTKICFMYKNGKNTLKGTKYYGSSYLVFIQIWLWDLHTLIKHITTWEILDLLIQFVSGMSLGYVPLNRYDAKSLCLANLHVNTQWSYCKKLFYMVIL
jgi:hypothetical protein